MGVIRSLNQLLAYVSPKDVIALKVFFFHEKNSDFENIFLKMINYIYVEKLVNNFFISLTNFLDINYYLK